jgi:hypothetical protein
LDQLAVHNFAFDERPADIQCPPGPLLGHVGANPSLALFEIGAHGPRRNPAGFTRVGVSTFDTTGILGVSRNANGQQAWISAMDDCPKLARPWIGAKMAFLFRLAVRR